MILIDSQKAFDTIDQDILQNKMTIFPCFTLYLTNRTFTVNVGKECSSPNKLSCSVPQGPLLFLLYVSDMPQAVNSKLLLYADDTSLIYTGKDIETTGKQLNKDFNSLCE